MRIVLLAGTIVLSAYAMGCSPAADPIGKGAASYKVDFPTDPDVTGSCNYTATAGLGSDQPIYAGGDAGVPDLPIAGRTDASTIDSWGADVSDGQTGSNGKGKYEVSCKVVGSETYNVEVLMSGPNTHPLVSTETGITYVKLTAKMDSKEGTGTGRATVQTTVTSAVTPSGGSECEFSLAANPNDPTTFAIAPGEARFVFTCKETTSALDDFSVCETRGTISVRDCLKE